MSTEEAGALSAQVHLPPHLGSAGSARRFLSSTLRGWHVPDDVVDVVNLLATELVGNAVHHGVGGVLVTVRTQPPPALRVEVHDDGPELPVLRDAEDDAESGRGLRLIELLASRWGTLRHRDDGKDVWFELDVHGTAAVPA